MPPRIVKPLVAGVGLLLIIAGVIFALQGVGDIRGSPMTGTIEWTVLGPIIALGGVGLTVIGTRRR